MNFTRQHGASVAAIEMPFAVREREAARFLGVSVGLIRKWRRIGGGPNFARLSGAVVYKSSSLQEFFDSSLSRKEVA